MKKEDVRNLRKTLGLTQEEFARVMFVSPRTISLWETGGTIPKAKEAHMATLSNNPKHVGDNNTMSGDVSGNYSITNNNNSCDESQAMKALLKSQEQIDRLIGVIETITGTPYNK